MRGKLHISYSCFPAALAIEQYQCCSIGLNKQLIQHYHCCSIMAGFLKLLANAQQFHRVAMPAILAHALQCFNVQSSKVSFPGLLLVVRTYLAAY